MHIAVDLHHAAVEIDGVASVGDDGLRAASAVTESRVNAALVVADGVGAGVVAGIPRAQPIFLVAAHRDVEDDARLFVRLEAGVDVGTSRCVEVCEGDWGDGGVDGGETAPVAVRRKRHVVELDTGVGERLPGGDVERRRALDLHERTDIRRGNDRRTLRVRAGPVGGVVDVLAVAGAGPVRRHAGRNRGGKRGGLGDRVRDRGRRVVGKRTTRPGLREERAGHGVVEARFGRSRVAAQRGHEVDKRVAARIQHLRVMPLAVAVATGKRVVLVRLVPRHAEKNRLARLCQYAARRTLLRLRSVVEACLYRIAVKIGRATENAVNMRIRRVR